MMIKTNMKEVKAGEGLIERDDFGRLGILVLLGLVIGIYLIWTTVLIDKDGVGYLEHAQRFGVDGFFEVVRQGSDVYSYPFGYPFLIFAAHKLAGFFTGAGGVYSWIYTGQAVTLIFRLMTLVVLYFIGKIVIGGKRSFWAVLILLFLPYSSQFGSLVLRDWPHLFFLSAGFLLLILGAMRGRVLFFGLCGAAAGMGHLIRPECGQLLIYGGVWLAKEFFSRSRNTSRLKLVSAMLVMVVCFSALAVPYGLVKGEILPPKVRALLSCCSQSTIIPATVGSCGNCLEVNKAGISVARLGGAVVVLLNSVCKHYMYYFMLPMLIGIYVFYRRRESSDPVRFFLSFLLGFNVLMMLSLYYNYGYISRRHCMPLVIFSIFFVPIGLEVLAGKLAGAKAKQGDQWRSFLILVFIGLLICSFKMFKPIRLDKKGYLSAAMWLGENTKKGDIVIVPDCRIGFYSGRQWRRESGGDERYLVEFEQGHGVGEKDGMRQVYKAAKKKGGKEFIVIYDLGSK